MMHTATILSPGYSLPSAKLPGLTRDTNIPGSPCIKLCPFPPSSLIPSLVDLSLATEKKIYTQWILQGRLEIRNFSSSVEKYFTSESSDTSEIPNHFTETVFSCERRDYVAIATGIFSHVKITCYFHV